VISYKKYKIAAPKKKKCKSRANIRRNINKYIQKISQKTTYNSIKFTSNFFKKIISQSTYI